MKEVSPRTLPQQVQDLVDKNANDTATLLFLENENLRLNAEFEKSQDMSMACQIASFVLLIVIIVETATLINLYFKS